MAGYREQRRSRREKGRRIPRVSVLAVSMAVAPPATQAFAPMAMPHVAHVPRSRYELTSVPSSSRKLRAIILSSPPSSGRRQRASVRRSSGCFGAHRISLCDERRMVPVSLKMATLEEDDRIRESPEDPFTSGGDCFAPEQEDSSPARRLRQGLRRLGRLRKPENVLGFLAAAKARDGSISLREFNVAISAVAACEGGPLYALKLLALMEEESVLPDRFSFTAVVASCCRCQQWHLAFRILAEMNRRGLRPLNLRASRFTTVPGEAGSSTRDTVLCFLQNLRRSSKLPSTPSEDTPVLVEYEGVIGRRFSFSCGKKDEKEDAEAGEQEREGGEEAGGVAEDDRYHRQERVKRNGIGSNSVADRVLVGGMHDCVKVAGVDGNDGGETYARLDDDGGILRNGVDNGGSVRQGVENASVYSVTRREESEGIARADARTRHDRRTVVRESTLERMRTGDVAGGESTAGSNRISKRSAINGEEVGSVTTRTTTTTITTAATTTIGEGASRAYGHEITGMFNSREEGCGGPEVSVEDIVAAGGFPEEDMFLSELKAAALKKDAAAALRILDCMRQAGHAPHQGAYACAIRACGKAGKWEQSLALMDEIESAGMQPGQGCHIMALKACAAAGRWEDTLEMLRRMSERGIDRPENAFAIAMKACGEAGRWREALALMEEMRRDGVLPMETAYCTAMKACGRAGEWRQALVLFNEMRTTGIPPTEQCFTAVIKACANAGETKEAFSLLREMRSVPAVCTNNAVYRAIIFACCKAGNWPLAVGLLEDARREQLKPKTGDLRAVLQACGKAGQYERALSLLEEMRSDGMHMRRTGEKLWWLFKDCADVRISRRAWALMEVEETRARLEQRVQRNAAAKPSGRGQSSTTATVNGSVSAATHVATGVKKI